MKLNRRRRATSFRRTAATRHLSLGRRSGTLELLERRELLAGDIVSGWHNTLNPSDVNFDQRVNATDLLAVFNDLLTNGSRGLSVDEATPLSSTPGAPRPSFVDVTGDNRVNTADALAVINQLLADPVLRISTIVTDLSGNEITQVSVGEQFMLRTIVQDVRDPAPTNPTHRGVNSAAADIFFDSALSSIDTTQTPDVGSFFNLSSDFTLTQGRVIGFAGSGSFTGPGNDPQYLFSVVLTATAAGIQTFTPTLDTTSPDHVNGVYTATTPLPPENVVFVGDTLEIVGGTVPQFTISDVSKSETNADNAFNFTVTLSQALAESATVAFATSNGTAIAPGDYTATSGTLTFAPGQTTAVISVTVKGDQNVEPNETFSVMLSNNSSNTEIGDATGVGTILNDDILGSLSISGGQVDAIAGSTTQGAFTVTLSTPPAGAVTVQYTTANGTATAGSDYTATSGTLTFTPGGSLSQVIPLTILGDTTVEPVEQFVVNLSNPSVNAQITTGQAQIVINPALTGVKLSVNPATLSVDEGNAGTQSYVFTVALSEISSEQVVVAYATQDGSATVADSDYIATSGTLTYAPGETTKLVTVQVQGDTISESNETFKLNVNAIEGSASTSSATVTIVDDDGPATITVSDATVAAGAGITTAVFTVTLSGPVVTPVSVGFATSDGTATAGVDYLQATGNLLFQPGGPRTQTVEVTILGSTGPKPDQSFFLNLSSVTPPGVVIGDDLGVGTIITQGISIADAVVVEGNEGTRAAIFTVTLSRESSSPVTVAYATADGAPGLGNPATVAGGDYQQASGTLTFAPGVSTRLVTVLINGDTTVEPNEFFRVDLSNATGAPIFNGVGTGTIVNDDGKSVSYRLVLTDEDGNIIPANQQLDVGESFYLNVFVQDVQGDPTGVAQAFLDVSYNDALLDVDPSTLVFGDFYNDTFAFSDFEPGLLNDFGAFGSIDGPPVPSNAELLLYKVKFRATDVGLVNFTGSVDEADLDQDHFTLLYGSPNADPVPSSQISVQDRSINIGSNVVTVTDAQANENAGTMVFTVTRFLPTSETATVVYSTQNGTATAGQDFTATSGTLTFAAGTTVQLVTVQIINDTLDEPDETFSLVLSNPVGADISAAAGTGTIIDNDGPVSVSVSGGSASEGQGVVFNVSLSAPSGKTVTVVYNTSGTGTATPGVDYTPALGTLTFAPGVTQQSVTVSTLSDVLLEANETFQLVLSSPSNATLGTAQGTGTIVDVPPAGISGYVYVDLNNNGLKDANETGIQGAIVTVTNTQTGASQSTLTAADGSYTFVGLIPGTYKLKETQPGFYNDGRDTRFGVDSPLNDEFSGIVLSPSEAESGYNFGERGIRSEFVSVFLNRRALFASAVVGGGFGPTIDAPGSVLDLRGGDVWVSFDGAWSGLRQIDALYNPAGGSVVMKLYNNRMEEVAISAPSATGSVLFYNGTLGDTYFLNITGTNANVVVKYSTPTGFSLPAGSTGGTSGSSATSTGSSSGSTGGGGSTGINRFGIPMTAAPAADPLVASGDGDDSASEEAFSEDADWLLEALLS
jgi:hypothetical protein